MTIDNRHLSWEWGIQSVEWRDQENKYQIEWIQ